VRIGWVEGSGEELSKLARHLPFPYQIWALPTGRECLVIFGINDMVAAEITATGSALQVGELLEAGCGKKSG